MASSTPNAGQARTRGGITLLEVLISCALLLVGLTAMAAMLPAAGSRLSQASIEDRAAVLLANAFGEMFNRGLVAADIFPASPVVGGSAKPVVTIGRILGGLPELGDLPSGGVAADYFIAPSEKGLTRCGTPRTFLLEDGLVFSPASGSDGLTNSFLGAAGAAGPRRFREGVCWGATLAPESFPPRAGQPATLSIAIFKRDGSAGQSRAGTSQVVPLVLRRFKNFYESDITPNGSLLRACSWVLAMPTTSGTSSAPPTWFKIVSSWTWRTPQARTTRLIVGDQGAFATLTSSTATDSTALVLAFEDLVRVDVQTVTLN